MFNDARIWKSIVPGERIEENEPLRADRSYTLSSDERLRQMALLKEDGYSYIPSLIEPEKVARMLTCVDAMIDRKIPPVFCFVFDVFWQLILDLKPLLSEFLQGEFLIISNAWTWLVDNHTGVSYFPPHRDVDKEDFIDEQGMPTLFSLWIPLTDVSTYHSCMHVLPGSRDPDYPHNAGGWREKWKREGHSPWKVEDLVNIRALPSPKGSFLGWNAGVMHWGSKPHPKAGRRISIGYYLHAPHAKIKHKSLIDLSKPFLLEDRIRVIFESLRIYGKSLEVKSALTQTE